MFKKQGRLGFFLKDLGMQLCKHPIWYCQDSPALQLVHAIDSVLESIRSKNARVGEDLGENNAALDVSDASNMKLSSHIKDPSILSHSKVICNISLEGMVTYPDIPMKGWKDAIEVKI